MARTTHPVDWDRIDLYLKAGATQIKIAAALGVSIDTLQRRIKEKHGIGFTEYACALRATGELLIEAKQYEKALSGNIQMLLWLGKIRCGQREPDLLATTPPAQDDLDKDHLIMRLEHKIEQLQESLKNNGNEPKTE